MRHLPTEDLTPVRIGRRRPVVRAKGMALALAWVAGVACTIAAHALGLAV
jgi:hypothetical protein